MGYMPVYYFNQNSSFGTEAQLRQMIKTFKEKKVGIIAALFNHPQLVILDEPFNFLDPSSQIVLKKTLTDYCQQTGATVLISSHNLQHTVDISSRIILMEHGKLIKDLPNENRSPEKELEAYFEI